MGSAKSFIAYLMIHGLTPLPRQQGVKGYCHIEHEDVVELNRGGREV